MTIKTELAKLTRYKSWANDITFSALSNVSQEELYKERPTNFSTIVSTLNHVYVVDDIFKSHLTHTPHHYSQRNTETCPEFLVLWEQQKIIDSWYLDYIEQLEEKDLGKNIPFTFIDGKQGNMSISDIFFHIVNHGTYHRGLVSDMMYQIPSPPPANDLTVYLTTLS